MNIFYIIAPCLFGSYILFTLIKGRTLNGIETFSWMLASFIISGGIIIFFSQSPGFDLILTPIENIQDVGAPQQVNATIEVTEIEAESESILNTDILETDWEIDID